MIAYIFGEQVASQVEALSRNKPHGKISSAEILDILVQQEKYDVALIKIVDRLHNLETIGAKSPEKAKKILKETLKYFLSILIKTDNFQLEQKFYDILVNNMEGTLSSIFLEERNTIIPSSNLRKSKQSSTSF